MMKIAAFVNFVNNKINNHKQKAITDGQVSNGFFA